MIALVDVVNETVLQIFPVEQEAAVRAALPDGSHVSPVSLGWSGGDYAVYSFVRFSAPDGYYAVGEPSYTFDHQAKTVTETRDIEEVTPLRRRVRKSVILSRLTDEQVEAAMALLTAKQKERWRAPDQPTVYVDDPETLAVLQAIEADVDAVMAEEE